MIKPKVLLIDTGGTLSATPDENGVLGTGEKGKNWFDLIAPKVSDIADVSLLQMPRIDSTEMNTSNRRSIAKELQNNYSSFDGFVIAHGTDTMAETACALNYMFQKTGKPIILTGSQVSIFEAPNDGEINVINSIQAATSDLGEIAIVFDGKILRGNKTIKESEYTFNAFSTPDVRTLGEFTMRGIQLYEHCMRRRESAPRVFTNFDERVFQFEQVSGAKNEDVLERIVADDWVQGFIIGGFGAGNVHPKYAPAVEEATRLGKPVFITTNCNKGSAETEKYEVNKKVIEAGAFSAKDLTKQAATQKLMYALGIARYLFIPSNEKLSLIRSIIYSNIGHDIQTNQDLPQTLLDFYNPKERRNIPKISEPRTLFDMTP